MEATRRRIREGWVEEEAALREVPFPVLGLAGPHPNPVALQGTASADGEVTKIGLAYGGDPEASPRVVVNTYPLERCLRPPDLARLARTFGPEDWDRWPEPSGQEAIIPVAGQTCRAEVAARDSAWVLRVEATVNGVDLLVAVFGRDWPLEQVGLTEVEDLETFFAGRRERMEALFARSQTRPGPEDWALPATDGVDAHLELARSSHDHRRAALAAMTEGRRVPRFQEGEPQRWERATRAQMSLTGQPRDKAEDAVHSMINHLGELAQHATWLDSDLADRAMAETIDHVALAHEVPSEPAQQAWSRWWNYRRARPAHRDRPRFGPQTGLTDTEANEQQQWFAEMNRLKNEWETAWQHWVQQQQQQAQ